MTATVDLVENQPPDMAALGDMLSTADDLKLVWPDANVPFDADQWHALLTAEPARTSYWVDHAGARVGHAVLVATDEPGVMAPSFLYILPAARGGGLGGALMTALEDVARSQGATAMRLRTRTYNPRAVAVYTKVGYQPSEQDGTLIIMRKQLV